MDGDTPYKRRKDGCRTCRQRRVKCGREKPKCGHCERLSLKEVGPTRRASRAHSHSTTDSANDIFAAPQSSGEVIGALPAHQLLTNSHDGTFNAMTNPDNPPSQSSVLNLNPTGSCFGDVGQADNPATTGPSLGADIDFDLFFGLSDPFFSTFPAADGGEAQINPFDDNYFPPLPEPSPSNRQFCCPVKPDTVDQPVATHFVESVSNAAITRPHQTPNYYISLFAASFFCPALFAGMLAWSAWHMANTVTMEQSRRQDLLDYAAQQHNTCGQLLFRDLDIVNTDSNSELEAVYCTFMVYGQYQLVTCAPVSSVRSLLEHVDKVHTKRPLTASSSPLLQRMASILAASDMKISLFGSAEPKYALRLGADVFDHSSPQSSSGAFSVVSPLHMLYLSAKCSDVDARIRRARDRNNVEEVRANIRAGDELYDRVMALQSTLNPPRLKAYAQYPSDDSCDAIFAIAQSDLDQSLSFDIRFDLMLAAQFHGVVLQLCRILNYPTPSLSINRILGIILYLDRQDTEGLHTVLAHPALFAGLETKDPAQYNEVLAWFSSSNIAASGVRRIQRTKQLLEDVKRAEADGTRRDVGLIMQQTNVDVLA